MDQEEKVLETPEIEETQAPQEDLETQEIDKEAELSEKLKESEDKYLRLYAEYENYKKRTLRR